MIIVIFVLHVLSAGSLLPLYLACGVQYASAWSYFMAKVAGSLCFGWWTSSKSRASYPISTRHQGIVRFSLPTWQIMEQQVSDSDAEGSRWVRGVGQTDPTVLPAPNRYILPPSH